jgi:hypothetical protein
MSLTYRGFPYPLVLPSIPTGYNLASTAVPTSK